METPTRTFTNYVESPNKSILKSQSRYNQSISPLKPKRLDGGCMMVSELGSCANLHTQAETAPDMSFLGGTTPLRHKNSHSSLYSANNTHNKSILTSSQGIKVKSGGERFSYSLGGGNYLLLEEVDSKTP